MIKFINYLPCYVCGNIFTLNDYYNEIKNNLNCELYFIIDYDNIYGNEKLKDIKDIKVVKKINTKILNIAKLISKNFFVGKYSIFNENTIEENDTIITTFWSLYYGKLYQKINKKIDKLIILDSLDIYLSYINKDISNILIQLPDYCNYIYVLTNPFNIDILNRIDIDINNIDIIEYYNKLSSYRINKLYKNEINNTVLTKSEILIDKYKDIVLYKNNKIPINVFDYNKYAYCRHYNIIDENNKSIYIENIGKIIFEYLLLNKKVDYYTYNKCLDDGLHYYLKLINIDDNKNYLDINIDNKLKQKLLIENNDFIYKLIS